MVSRPRIFVTRMIPERGLDILRQAGIVDVWPGELPPSREELLDRARGIHGLLCLLTDQIDAAVMEAAADSLKVISNYAVGYDNVAVADATRRGIPVGNTPDVLTETTADFAFALMMAAARRLIEADRYVREGHWRTWSPMLLLGQDVFGATLGIIGYGRIGSAIARRACGFNMRILYHNRACRRDAAADSLGAECVELERLLRESDFITLQTPLTEETYHLIDATALELMKPTAVLINTARGGVVDLAALETALRAGRLFYAAMDVTEPEPLPADSPLLTLPNVILAPHIASASTATRTKMAEIAAKNLVAGLAGRPLPHCVNPEVYERAGQG